MTSRYLTAAALIFSSSLVFADSTENYRSAFLDHCTDGERDTQTRQMCACLYDDWQAGLESKTDPHAVNAAKLMSNTQVDLYPSEIQAAAMHSQAMTTISSRCADKVMGKISLGGDTVGLPQSHETDDVYPSTTSTSDEMATGKKRGMLGAVVGWAGRKAGLPDMVNEAAADKVDENETSIKSKLNPMNSRFNPFKKNKDSEAAAEE